MNPLLNVRTRVLRFEMSVLSEGLRRYEKRRSGTARTAYTRAREEDVSPKSFALSGGVKFPLWDVESREEICKTTLNPVSLFSRFSVGRGPTLRYGMRFLLRGYLDTKPPPAGVETSIRTITGDYGDRYCPYERGNGARYGENPTRI